METLLGNTEYVIYVIQGEDVMKIIFCECQNNIVHEMHHQQYLLPKKDTSRPIT